MSHMEAQVEPHYLDALFRPNSFALIGASDKSTFSRLLVQNLRAAGHGENIHLVNPRSNVVHNQATVARCADLPVDVDLAFVMVPVERVPDALRDAALAGVKAAAVLSSGYAELGPLGIQRQKELVDLARELKIVLLGPNVLGYINVLDNIPAMALSDPPQRRGNVALISQSGASCGAMKDFAEISGVDLSHVITVGNEAYISIAEIMDYLIQDTRVKALALFIESIKDTGLFASVARKAAALEKPIVALKAGKSELAARAAASHTGSIVGDDRVIEAMFEHLGIIRVNTVEDMLITAGLGAYTGPLPEGGVGVASISGGACDIIADLAEEANLELPAFSEITGAELEKIMPEFGHAHNPLDVTGAALTTPGLWRKSIETISEDPSVAITVVINSLPWRDDGKPFHGESFVGEIGQALSESPKQGIYVTQVSQPIGWETRELLQRNEVPHTVTGLRGAVEAIAKITRWSRRINEPISDIENNWAPTISLPVHSGTMSEAASRSLLEAFGVPFVPSASVKSGSEASEAAARWPQSKYAIKVLSADVPHKSDVGGVLLDIKADLVCKATDEMLASVQAQLPNASIDGALISPMRSPAVELIVGITRDDDWGLMLAVGLGGVLVEVLNDVALAPVPVDKTTVLEMLNNLRGSELLKGIRGTKLANIDLLAEVITQISSAAAAMGDRLETVEINPLRVDGSQIEALDALVILRDPGE